MVGNKGRRKMFSKKETQVGPRETGRDREGPTKGGGGPLNHTNPEVNRTTIGILTLHFVPKGTVADIPA